MRDAGVTGRLPRGTRLIGKYEIVRPIGQGGFGLVYEATHLGLRARVAIKLLHSEVRHHAQTMERFRREAWASAQLTSQHAVRVMDVDVLEDGSPFIVMELLRGRDLEAELSARGRLPIREAVGYVLQAASAIAEAHTLGIIHRDLKPNNLFIVDPSGLPQLKVLDFGLSKIASDLSLTRTTAQIGTPMYMSPEQFRSGKDIDCRSDIWALGVILYRLLALRAPFVGENRTDLMVAISSQSPPELRQLAPNVPPALAAIVMRALSKDRANRFHTVSEMAAVLAPFGPPGAFIAPLARSTPPTHRPSTTLTDSSQDTPQSPTHKSPSRALFWAGAAAAVVALGFGLRGAYVRATDRAAAPLAAPAAQPAVTPVSRAASAPTSAPVISPAAASLTLNQAQPLRATLAPSAVPSAPFARPAVPKRSQAPANTPPAARPAAGKSDLGF